ncbi:nitrite/sulfite reductase [Luteithermobacter gelatinilyticus]|uniref:nitrite/sulfite reductase n=1 Tax=Luteithermobacter gelatinilyticus TaxID=2582913 RepID=UPI0011063272|nr:nitrite/sulfite reductase [Luteithermobacter gelatinilyticus]|tara:strand:+ start:15494 stop:17158 length:1665 start_codon:yes stop_codon:yes gene_type:complete
MYIYDDYDQKIVNERVAQFRGQVARRLSGELTEEEFRPLRLQNGLYLQLHAYMLRVAIPYGLLSSRQLRMLAHVARKYDKGYGHFTTRQNIQYNWPKLEDVPDILADLATVQMHAIQTSGNCIRNISADQYAGVAGDEVVDPRPYAEIMRQWSTFHPEFVHLPRKFKMAFTGAKTDRAAILFHDIGYRATKNDAGEIGFEVYVGGGMGRTPMVGKLINAFVPEKDLLTYTEAIMRVYNRYGRRDNMFKARIKILVHELKLEEFTRRVEEEWHNILEEGGVELDQAEIDRVKAHFTEPEYETLPAKSAVVEQLLLDNRDFSWWYKQNVVAHKKPGYAIVIVSLKKPGVPPGDATDKQMEAVADLADQYSFGEIRTTHDQNLVLADVKQDDLPELWENLKALGFATPNIGTLQDMICCPGLDYCSLANARSIPIAERISQHFDDMDYLYDLGQLKLKMSGCINACGHHHVGHIGILGVDKKGTEYYQITLGGSESDDASIGKIMGPAFGEEEIVPAIDRLLKTYVALREEGERFLDTYRRVGMAPFKEAVYADHQA